MSARKLSRFAGLVFVLAAMVGGVGAASAVVEHEAGGPGVAGALVDFRAAANETVWG
jgi:hypothetical protein